MQQESHNISHPRYDILKPAKVAEPQKGNKPAKSSHVIIPHGEQKEEEIEGFEKIPPEAQIEINQQQQAEVVESKKKGNPLDEEKEEGGEESKFNDDSDKIKDKYKLDDNQFKRIKKFMQEDINLQQGLITKKEPIPKQLNDIRIFDKMMEKIDAPTISLLKTLQNTEQNLVKHDKKSLNVMLKSVLKNQDKATLIRYSKKNLTTVNISVKDKKEDIIKKIIEAINNEEEKYKAIEELNIKKHPYNKGEKKEQQSTLGDTILFNDTAYKNLINMINSLDDKTKNTSFSIWYKMITENNWTGNVPKDYKEVLIELLDDEKNKTRRDKLAKAYYKPAKGKKKKGDDIDSESDDENLGLYNDEIDQIMEPEFKNYMPVICVDELADRLNEILENNIKNFQFIINTISSKSKLPSGHYVAINKTPDSLEFYDPLAEYQPSDEMKKEFKKLFEKLEIPHYLKMKINKVKQQSDYSANCGEFCMRFLAERNNHVPFEKATHYPKGIKKNEEEIEEFKKGFGFI